MATTEPNARPKTRFYYRNLGTLKQDLAAVIPREELRDLHRVQGWRHFAVVARHLVVVTLCIAALVQTRWPWFWPFAALLQGGNILGFVVLLHEQVHKSIFAKSRPRLERLLGLLYAFPSGISATQFAHWHIDHHNELGDDHDDPKRAHLTPKRNARWLKLLYMTPYLFFVYARAASQEARRYPVEEQRTIRRERLGNVLAHLALLSLLLWLGGFWLAARVQLIPLFFCFPPMFVLNRLGQHFDIDPSDPAKWSSLVNGNRFWHFVFLWSNFHIEHHYYQRVPFYRLKELNQALQPFFAAKGMRNLHYRKMLWGWLVKNRRAHTDWSLPG